MKKSILAAALAVMLTGASAQTAFVNTDYTRATGSNWFSNYENRVGIRTPTNEFGAFDIVVIYNITKTNDTTSSKGAEVGFTSTDYKFDDIKLNGRVGFGGVSYDYYYSLQGEAKYALDPSVQPVIQYRFRDGFDSSALAENRILLGADFAVTKDIGIRFGYTYTAIKGPDLNGLSATVNFGF